METKKSKNANLENKRVLFMEIGLVLALALVFLGFEWSKSELEQSSLGTLTNLVGEEEIVPITRPELQKPVIPPKPQTVVLELNIVDDDIELEDDFELDDFEANQDDIIEIIQIEEVEEDDDYIFMLVEDMPIFQGGGIDAFHSYIQGKIRYPRIAEENNISGIVNVSFVINRKGVLTDIEILRGVDPSLNNEVIRALKAAPNWTPGKQRGKPALVRMSMPVKFTLL
jgi:protein TonB